LVSNPSGVLFAVERRITLTTQADEEKESPVISKLRRSPEEYMKDRVQLKINRYTKKASNYKLAYRVTASVAAIGSAVVPVLVNIPNMERKYPTIVSLLVVFVVALESVFHFREHWRNYDLISSVLREEEMQFSTRAGPYSPQEIKGNHDDVFRTFVKRVEDAIANERAETIVMRTTAPSSEAKPGQG
jgi:hypothetical protein